MPRTQEVMVLELMIKVKNPHGELCLRSTLHGILESHMPNWEENPEGSKERPFVITRHGSIIMGDFSHPVECMLRVFPEPENYRPEDLAHALHSVIGDLPHRCFPDSNKPIREHWEAYEGDLNALLALAFTVSCEEVIIFAETEDGDISNETNRP